MAKASITYNYNRFLQTDYFVMHQWIAEEEPGTGPLVLSKQNSKYKNLNR